jgi:hypothetical protein
MDQQFSDLVQKLNKINEAWGGGSPAIQGPGVDDSQSPIHGEEMDEGSMAAATHHKSGSKFGGYWKGTDKNPPKPGQGVGGCAEDINLEEELMNEWNRYLDEYGSYGSQPTGTAAAGGVQNPANPQQQQQDADAVKKLTGIVGQAKNKGILPTGTSTTNATQAIAQNPALNKASGQQKQELGAVANNLNTAMQKASKNPQAQSDLNTAMSALQRIGKLPG